VADGHVPQAVLDEAATQLTPDEPTRLVYAVIEINAWNRLAVTVGAPEPGSYQIAAADTSTARTHSSLDSTP
jgi:hypothetical protein